MKRHRERELSGLSVRKILRSMKKRRARCKFEVIMRKSTHKSSRFYSLATDYKFWYVKYLNRSDCFFSNFVNLNRVTANKLLRKSKGANNPSLANHKTTKSSSHTERFCVKNEALDIRWYWTKSRPSTRCQLSNFIVSRFHHVVKLSIMSAGIETPRCWWCRWLFFQSCFTSVIWWSKSSLVC